MSRVTALRVLTLPGGLTFSLVLFSLFLPGCASEQTAPEPPPAPEWMRVIPEDPEYVYFVGAAEGTEPVDRLEALARDRARSDAVEYLRTEVRSEFILEQTDEGREMRERIVVRAGGSVIQLEYPERRQAEAQDSAGRTITRVSVLARMVRPTVYWSRELDRLEQLWREAAVSGSATRLLREGMLLLSSPLLSTDAPDEITQARRDRMRAEVERTLRVWVDETLVAVQPARVVPGLRRTDPLCVSWPEAAELQWEHATLSVTGADGRRVALFEAAVVDGGACFAVTRLPLSAAVLTLALDGAVGAVWRLPVGIGRISLSVSVAMPTPVPEGLDVSEAETVTLVQTRLEQDPLFIAAEGSDSDGALELKAVRASFSRAEDLTEGALAVLVTGLIGEMPVEERIQVAALGPDVPGLWRILMGGVVDAALERIRRQMSREDHTP